MALQYSSGVGRGVRGLAKANKYRVIGKFRGLSAMLSPPPYVGAPWSKVLQIGLTPYSVYTGMLVKYTWVQYMSCANNFFNF